MITRNQWQFVAATYDYESGTAYLYVNGTEVGKYWIYFFKLGKVTIASQFPLLGNFLYSINNNFSLKYEIALIL